MNYTRITFKQNEPTAQNAPQRPQERELAEPCKDTGDGLESNTEPLEAVGGAQGEPDSKKVLGKSVFIEPDQPKP